ncbi:hypothetical protein BU25DRAFT_258106 [Macroventuria anomochaeta]|uniref:Uncharacterized protein n=1 Tax=Macroventuria anomochaeta TaxID=301207 RepID=A0ACB6S8Z5_9PLEO|nr:uncharacterized protein BU25DRAFT_258106 [Macroventuria anomochaeta]KAF2630448.1 hypothetical protein BU25DRAFT_258106 [Macroventuria anomochaeta]
MEVDMPQCQGRCAATSVRALREGTSNTDWPSPPIFTCATPQRIEHIAASALWIVPLTSAFRLLPAPYHLNLVWRHVGFRRSASLSPSRCQSNPQPSPTIKPFPPTKPPAASLVHPTPTPTAPHNSSLPTQQ